MKNMLCKCQFTCFMFWPWTSFNLYQFYYMPSVLILCSACLPAWIIISCFSWPKLLRNSLRARKVKMDDLIFHSSYKFFLVLKLVFTPFWARVEQTLSSNHVVQSCADHMICFWSSCVWFFTAAVVLCPDRDHYLPCLFLSAHYRVALPATVVVTECVHAVLVNSAKAIWRCVGGLNFINSR